MNNLIESLPLALENPGFEKQKNKRGQEVMIIGHIDPSQPDNRLALEIHARRLPEPMIIVLVNDGPPDDFLRETDLLKKICQRSEIPVLPPAESVSRPYQTNQKKHRQASNSSLAHARKFFVKSRRPGDYRNKNCS